MTQFGPPQQQFPAPRRIAPLIVAGVAGLLVGAAVVGGTWLLTSDSAGGGTVTMPAKIGQYSQIESVFAAREDKSAGGNTAAQAKAKVENSKRLAAAHNGAPAAVQVYSDTDLKSWLTVMVVRSDSPHPIYVEYSDPERLQVARPAQELQTFGEVGCEIRNQLTPAGRDADPGQVVRCLRSGGGLTVEIRPTGPIGTQPSQIAGLINEVWSAVG